MEDKEIKEILNNLIAEAENCALVADTRSAQDFINIVKPIIKQLQQKEQECQNLSAKILIKISERLTAQEKIESLQKQVDELEESNNLLLQQRNTVEDGLVGTGLELNQLLSEKQILLERLEKIDKKVKKIRDAVNDYISEDDTNYFTNIIDETSLDIECLIEQTIERVENEQ